MSYDYLDDDYVDDVFEDYVDDVFEDYVDDVFDADVDGNATCAHYRCGRPCAFTSRYCHAHAGGLLDEVAYAESFSE